VRQQYWRTVTDHIGNQSLSMRAGEEPRLLHHGFRPIARLSRSQPAAEAGFLAMKRSGMGML
jgi:hypothetical protein